MRRHKIPEWLQIQALSFCFDAYGNEAEGSIIGDAAHMAGSGGSGSSGKLGSAAGGSGVRVSAGVLLGGRRVHTL